jgi:hypothetical protein
MELASVGESYVRDISKKLSTYHATWLPSQLLSLGDFGYFQGSFFVRSGNLSEVGYCVQGAPRRSDLSIEYLSHAKWSVLSGGRADASLSGPCGKAAVSFEFSKVGAYVVSLEHATELAISDTLGLTNFLVSAAKEGSWDIGQVVVSSIIETSDASILISCETSGQLLTEMTADLAGSVGIACLRGEFGVVSQKGTILRYGSSSRITPFFQVLQLTRAPHRPLAFRLRRRIPVLDSTRPPQENGVYRLCSVQPADIFNKGRGEEWHK